MPGGVDRVDRCEGVLGRLQAFLADAPRIVVGKSFVGGHAPAHAIAELTFGDNGGALRLSEGGMCAYEYQSGTTNRSQETLHCESPNIGGPPWPGAPRPPRGTGVTECRGFTPTVGSQLT